MDFNTWGTTGPNFLTKKPEGKLAKVLYFDKGHRFRELCEESPPEEPETTMIELTENFVVTYLDQLFAGFVLSRYEYELILKALKPLIDTITVDEEMMTSVRKEYLESNTADYCYIAEKEYELWMERQVLPFPNFSFKEAERLFCQKSSEMKPKVFSFAEKTAIPSEIEFDVPAKNILARKYFLLGVRMFRKQRDFELKVAKASKLTKKDVAYGTAQIMAKWDENNEK